MKSRRIFAFLLAALLLTSCGKTAAETEKDTDTAAAVEPVETETETETETELQDHLPEMDLNGYNYRMYITSSDERRAMAYVPEQTGEAVNDAVYQKIAAVEERFNVDITMDESAPKDNNLSAPTKSITAGDDAFDIIQGQDIAMANASISGLFYNIYDVPYMDTTKPWWPAKTVKSMTVADQLYLMNNNITYHALSATFVLFFNKDIMTDMGMEYPYDMVHEGTWTMDTLIEMSNNAYVDLNGDGIKGLEDQLGILYDNAYWGIMEPFELETYKKDENGNLYYDFDVEKNASFVEKMYALLFGEGGFIQDYANPLNGNEIKFSEGHSLFRYAKFSYAVTIYSQADIRYGVLPIPKLNEAQSQYNGGGTDRPLAIPVSAVNNLEAVGLVSEALNIEGYKKVFPAYFETAMKTRYADDSEDAKMMDIIRANTIISYDFMFATSGSYQNMLVDLFNGSTPNTDVASWAAKKEKSQVSRVASLQKFYDEHRSAE